MLPLGSGVSVAGVRGGFRVMALTTDGCTALHVCRPPRP